MVGLYPHIPHGEGLEALTRAFDNAESKLPVDELISLARLVLENNYLEFDEKIFRQKLGTAIGTKFAPGFANIFMAYLEEKFLSTCKLRPWVWWRFLDDAFVIWLHLEEELNFFLSRLNSFHETIKFTWEIGYRQISCLDVRVLLEDGLLHTDVYSKPTDTHQYLNYKSCHPPHVKRGIPYGQALRFKRICDLDEVFERRLDDLRGFLVNRGYEKDFVENQFSRAREVDRCNLFDRGEKKDQSNGVNLVIDYHPALRCLYIIFKELQSLVNLSAVLSKIIPKEPMICYRRPKNLKDHLVRAKLHRMDEVVVGMFKCEGKRCKVCDSVVVGNTFRSTVSGRIFYINHRFNCDSSGVVYLITCKKCEKQYVGNTVTPFRKRFNNHKSSLNRFGKGQKEICGKHLYSHFYTKEHLGIKDLSVMIIDVTNVYNPTERESFWMEKLCTYIPTGLNVREEI